MRLPEMPEVPVMTEVIFAGESKPESVEDYLRSFVTELNYLEKFGILINGRQFKIKQTPVPKSMRLFANGLIKWRPIRRSDRSTFQA